MLSPSATNPDLTKQGSRFSTAYHSPMQRRVRPQLSISSTNSASARSPCYMTAKTTESLAEIVKTEFEALGGEVVEFMGII